MSAAAVVSPSRNGLLATVKKGREQRPPKLLLYGIPGIGKSTFASKMPDPIFIQTEDGVGEIDCAKFPLAESFTHVLDQLASLYSEPHEYRTVVIDTLDWLEKLVWKSCCERHHVKNIEDVAGGYAKGYTYCLEEWAEITRRLDVLHDRGMLVCLLAHCKVERFEDPENPSYDRYSPRLNKHAAAIFVEWASAVLFATRKISTRKEKGGFNKERAIASGVGNDGGERVLRTVGGPACIAKNRYGIGGELPLEWSSFVAEVQKGRV